LEKNKFPVSEYQREYEWKKFAIGDSPLLNAEKIVFDSHTNIPRFIRAKVPRKTEYQSKFAETRRVAWKEKKENKDEHEESEGMSNRLQLPMFTSNILCCGVQVCKIQCS
jgi:hypothetical protein